MIPLAQIQLFTQLCKTNFANQYGTGFSAYLKILVKPFFVLFIFTLVFDQFIKIDTGTVPYPIFAFSGLIVWEASFSAFMSALSFFNKNASLLKNFSISVKMLQLVDIAGVFIEAFVKIIVFNCLCFFVGDYNVFNNFFLFNIFILLPIIVGFGIGLWFVVIDTKKKNMTNNLPYFLGYIMWLTPIFFPESLIPQNLQFLVYYNPVAELIYFLRKYIIGIDLQMNYMGFVSIIFVILASVGFLIFKRRVSKLIEII